MPRKLAGGEGMAAPASRFNEAGAVMPRKAGGGGDPHKGALASMRPGLLCPGSFTDEDAWLTDAMLQ